MRAALLLSACLALNACLASRCFWSAYGVTHCPDGLEGTGDTPGEAATVEQELRRELVVERGWPMRRVDAALDAAEVHWEPAPWLGPDGVLWSGSTSGHIIRLARGPNWRAVYRHELTHLIGAYLGHPDAHHLENFP